MQAYALLVLPQQRFPKQLSEGRETYSEQFAFPRAGECVVYILIALQGSV